jgi:hypothetical protein
MQFHNIPKYTGYRTGEVVTYMDKLCYGLRYTEWMLRPFEVLSPSTQFRNL